MSHKPVAVRVPGSTSNLGSGFDTLGLALNFYNTIRVRPIAGTGIVARAPDDPEVGADGLAMSIKAADLFFVAPVTARSASKCRSTVMFPAGRGLGYSATVRVGVLAALNVLARARLSREQLLELAVQLEGHPDNASPAVFGGFTVSGMIVGGVRCLYFGVSSKLKLVTLVPPFGINTVKARALLPATYAQADTAHALNRASLITAALISEDFESLRGAFDDRMHQPYRKKLLPRMARVITAGEEAGAIGGFLSGSGSSIICVTVGEAKRVAASMKKQIPTATVRILSPDDAGYRVLS